MTFRLDHLRRLGKGVSVPIPRDADGFLGRECPEKACEGYFKVKPGTGLTGRDLSCHCPYCGHRDSSDKFFTQEQIEYAKSIVLGEVTNALRADLKTMEFDYKAKGPFGIGLSLKLQPRAPVPIRHYRERTLETRLACTSCSLEYAVYGVFAFCPDCGVHNSVQILQRNLELVTKQLELSETVPDVDLQQHLREDALENCVSAFDGFARELCRVHASQSAAPDQAMTISCQNLSRAARRLKQLFAVDIEACVTADEWQAACRAFLRRHLLAHKAGVIDVRYIEESGEPLSLLRRRIAVTRADVAAVAATVDRLAVHLSNALNALPGRP